LGSSKDSFEDGSGFSTSSNPNLALLAGGTGFFVFNEKLKPDFGCVEAVGLVEGGAGLSSLGPSSSTRRSFEGRKGLSSASTAADCGSAGGCVAAGNGRGASVAGRPPRVPEAGVHERFENCVGGAPRPRPIPYEEFMPGPDERRSGPLKGPPRAPPWPPR
jgi:hypothetical protein